MYAVDLKGRCMEDQNDDLKKFQDQIGEKEDEKHYCDECKKYIGSIKAMYAHNRSMHTINIQMCEVCSLEFKNKDALRQHVKHVHVSDTPISCEHCGIVKKHKTSLWHHVKQVHDRFEVFCHICGAKCKNNLRLKRHVRKCTLKPRKTPSTYQNGKIVGSKLYCEECDRTYLLAKWFTTHISNSHKRVDLFCKICSFKTTIRLSMLNHYKNVHKIVEKILIKSVMGPTDGPGYGRGKKDLKGARIDCNKCGKNFSTSRYYNGHKKNCHPNQQLMPITKALEAITYLAQGSKLKECKSINAKQRKRMKKVEEWKKKEEDMKKTKLACELGLPPSVYESLTLADILKTLAASEETSGVSDMKLDTTIDAKESSTSDKYKNWNALQNKQENVNSNFDVKEPVYNENQVEESDIKTQTYIKVENQKSDEIKIEDSLEKKEGSCNKADLDIKIVAQHLKQSTQSENRIIQDEFENYMTEKPHIDSECYSYEDKDLKLIQTNIQPLEEIIESLEQIETRHDLQTDENSKTQMQVYNGIKESCSTENISNVLPCSQCAKQIKGNDNMKKHLYLWHQAGDFLCTECGIDFKFRGKYRNHFFSKHKNIELICTICNVTFKAKSSYTKHIKNIHGESDPKIKCEECGKCFKYKVLLWNHMRNVHDKQTSVCPECRKACKNQIALVRHIRHNHDTLEKEQTF